MINGMRFSIKGIAKTGLGLTGLAVWILSSFILWLMWLITWVDWLGGFGILIAIFATPGLVIFPFIYWIVENTFPFEYFLLWIIAGVGMMLMYSAGL